MSALTKVIVPCYGYGHLLEGCVDSVLDQEGVDIRVLIIDDSSPDDAELVGRRLARRDGRVEYRRHEANQGLIATANEGLKWASDSDYVVLLSADDFLLPGSLWRAMTFMDAHPDVGMVYGRAPYFETGRPLPRFGTRWRGTKVWSGSDWIRMRCRSGHNCISSPEVVVRTTVQQRVGPYDFNLPHSSDLNMWLRIAAVSEVAYVKGAAQALYRVHSDSMYRSMAGDPAGVIGDLRERKDAFLRFFEVAGGTLPEESSLRRLVGRALARQALWQASRAYDRNDVDGPGAAPVEQLVAFAHSSCPEITQLPEWRGLRLRQRIGAGRSLLFPPFIATGAAHRLMVHARRWRWRMQGV